MTGPRSSPIPPTLAIVPGSRANLKLRSNADSDDVVPKSASEKSVAIGRPVPPE
jgi:hypothetical protein